MLQVIDHTKPIVAIYSDGGPDHRVTYGSVQLSLINVFLQGDFDMIVAVRTPPCKSWEKPCGAYNVSSKSGIPVGMLNASQFRPEI